MKNILHVIDTTGPGGAETVFLQLAGATSNSSFNSIALIRGPGWVKDQLHEMGIQTIVLDCKGSFNLGYLRQVIRILRKHDIDLIQSHLLGSNVYCSIAGLIKRIPVVATFHGEVDISPKERFKLLKLAALSLGAKQIVAVTTRIENILLSMPLLSASQITTVQNGIDLSQYSKMTKPNLRTTLKLDSNTLLIGAVGNIRKPKNYPLAIDVIQALHTKNYRCHLAVAGQGNDKQMTPLLEQVERLGLQTYVHFMGFTKDIRDFLSSLDLFLMTSSSEGHPLALTQAMANELPIVSTPSGVEGIVSDNVSGCISSSHSAADVATCIIELIENNEKAQYIAKNAAEQAFESYSIEKMLNRYFEYYV